MRFLTKNQAICTRSKIGTPPLKKLYFLGRMRNTHANVDSHVRKRRIEWTDDEEQIKICERRLKRADHHHGIAPLRTVKQREEATGKKKVLQVKIFILFSSERAKK